MTDFRPYRRTAIAELAPWTPETDMEGVSVSEADLEAGSPKPGDMIARNPKNHADQWLVAAQYFRAHFEPVSPHQEPAEEDPWETIRQQMRELGREVWVGCLAAEGYAPTDRTPWAIPLSDMVRRHMDRLRSSVQLRRVMSRERLQEVFYWWADHPGDPPWEEVAAELGIEITPTEEPTDD